MFLTDSPLNDLLKAAERGVSQKVSLVGVRVLGILMYTFTGPFQKAFEAEVNILEMVPHCIKLQAAFEELNDDCSELLRNPSHFIESSSEMSLVCH